MTSKYVTQGEREMVEAVVGQGLVCECSDLVEGVHSSGIHLARPASAENGLAIYYVTEDTNHRPLLMHARANGTGSGRGINFDRDDVMERGKRLATREWVQDTLGGSIATGVVDSHNLNVGGVSFTQIGDGVYEYTQTDKFLLTIHPRVVSSQLPSNWCHTQLRHTGYDSDSNQVMQVRCMQDSGEPNLFEAVVYKQSN